MIDILVTIVFGPGGDARLARLLNLRSSEIAYTPQKGRFGVKGEFKYDIAANKEWFRDRFAFAIWSKCASSGVRGLFEGWAAGRRSAAVVGTNRRTLSPLMFAFRSAAQRVLEGGPSRRGRRTGDRRACSIDRAPITEFMLRKEVAHDLEALMNTVALVGVDLEDFDQVQVDLNFGLPTSRIGRLTRPAST